MKNKIVIIMVILAICSFSLAYANKFYEQQNIETYQEETQFQIEDISVDETNRIVNMSEHIKRTETRPEKINDLIYRYTYLIKVYDFSSHQMDYIDSLIYSGAKIDDILSICDFWLDTNYDIDLIGDIYLLRDKYFGSSWIEDAFNEVTENKHGVLNQSDISDYIDRGVSTLDIKTANVLSRKGVYTIQEILNMRIDGISWDEILSEIESNGNLKIVSVDDGNVILIASELSKETGIDISSYILNENAVNNINEEKENTDREIVLRVKNALTQLGVLVDPIMDKNNLEIQQDIKNIIKNNGISEDELNKLLSDGYMLMDVLNASEIYKSSGISIREIINGGGMDE